MTETVNVYDAKTRLSALLSRVEAGEEIIISRNGRPVARLTQVAARQPRTPGALRGQIVIADDFDELSDEDAALWYDAPVEP